MVTITAVDRTNIENVLDVFISNPHGMVENLTKDLVALRIEPSVDTILSMYCGFVLGFFSLRRSKEIREFIDEILPLFDRRAAEMRQAIINDLSSHCISTKF